MKNKGEQNRMSCDCECSIWVDCWECGGTGYSHHDCGEDTCVCLDKSDNVECDICEGEGGWYSYSGGSETWTTAMNAQKKSQPEESGVNHAN